MAVMAMPTTRAHVDTLIPGLHTLNMAGHLLLVRIPFLPNGVYHCLHSAMVAAS